MSGGRVRLHLAIQKSGRLAEPSASLLREAGLRVVRGKNDLSARAENFPVDLMYVRDDDIPTFVADGVCELGIVGRNVLEEAILADREARVPGVEVVAPLGFGRCDLRLAAPAAADYQGSESLAGQRIATSYPNLLRRFLGQHQIAATVVEMAGAVELAPRLGIAGYICDLVSTGSTLEANGLVALETVLRSEAVLIRTLVPVSPAVQNLADRLRRRIDGVLATQESKYIMLNAAEDSPGGDQPHFAGRRGADHPAAARPPGSLRRPRGLPRVGLLGDAAGSQGRRRLGDPRPAHRKDDDVRRLLWRDLTAGQRRAALARPPARHDPALAAAVRDIVSDIAARGWPALAGHALRLDGAAPRVEATAGPAAAAKASLAPDQLAALALAARDIGVYHEATLPTETEVEPVAGLVVRRVWRPIERVGLYIPGGATPLFSTLLMMAIPARCAGVPELVVATPPRADGSLDPLLAFAADLCDIEKVWLVGGAQAIAALAFGAGDIPKVDKICGPGNAWVARAKAEVAAWPGGPAVDLPAGPSELMVIADADADPDLVAADLLS